MKKELFKKEVILLIIAALLLALVLNLSQAYNFISWLYNAFAALIIGGCIAFVLNIFVDFFSHKVFKKEHFKNPKMQLTLSLVCSIILVLILLVVLVLIIIPQLFETFKTIVQKAPDIVNAIHQYFLSHFSNQLNSTQSTEPSFVTHFIDYLKKDLPEALTDTYRVVSSSTRSVITIFMALLISFYLVLAKDKLAVQAREFCYGIFPKSVARRAIFIAHLTSKDFKAFILGRVMDALLMAIAYVILALFFRLPYTLMIGSIIAVFSIIPLFGAIISWAIGFVLIITVSFWKAVIFTILILLILFVTRNFIYPKLIGDSLGLPDLWVLVAVVIGGKLFGLIGMITAVPVFSVFYHLISIFIHDQIKAKEVPAEDYLLNPNWQDYNELNNEFEDKES